MRFRILIGVIAAITVGAAALPAPAEGQFRRLRDAARRAAESEAESIVDQLIRNAIRCAIDDPICVSDAEEEGEDVIFVDDDGEIIVNEDGEPITNREEAMAASGYEEADAEWSVWANYDFVPGDRIIFYEDFSSERVGDFPRRIEFIEGNWEVVEVGSERYLRSTSAGSIKIPLPEELPDRFTVEFDVNTTHGNSHVWLTTGSAQGRDRSYEGSAVAVRSVHAGIYPVRDVGPRALTDYEADFLDEFRGQGMPRPLRVMADGDYMKVYLSEHRVANVPNTVFPRTDGLYISTASVSTASPALIGPIRIAAGGRDLYDRLAADGRVATQGILFAVDSDRIRPESTPTLEEIGRMLQDHPDLRLSIEGHTDSDGDDAHNQDLSERRAASVKAFLVDTYAIDAGRLESVGFGETAPVADNLTPEGKQQNRRVELVRLDGSD